MNTKNLKGSIIELRKSGKSVNEIKNILKCSKSTISFHLNNNNLGGVLPKYQTIKDDNDFIKDVGDEIINKIICYKKEGRTYKEIYNDVKIISLDKIKRICSIFHLNKQNNSIKFKDNNFIDMIKEEYEKIGNIKTVAKILSISHRSVRKYVNIPERKRIEVGKRKLNAEYVHRNRKSKKYKFVEYKGGCCQICGYKKSLNALHFHHINPNEKDFTIGGRNYNLERMKREVDKCLLLCSNCHVEIHEEIDNFGFSKFIEEYKNKL